MDRWRDSSGLQHPLWNERAARVAGFIPVGTRVLDVGCGAMLLERHLPFGCAYAPADLVQRDARTALCDLNAAAYPDATAADLITLLGVLEYVEPARLGALFGWLGATGRLALVTYSPTDFLAGEAERQRLGWINHLSFQALSELIQAHGLEVEQLARIQPYQVLLRVQRPRSRRAKRVQVVSFNHAVNFGDRLGYQLINGLLPAHCDVVHTHFGAERTDGEPDDLVVVGLGNSVMSPVVTTRLLAAVGRARRAIGIFGTQYRRAVNPDGLEPLLDRLDAWYARSLEDCHLLRRHERKTVALGDWLIAAFPMTAPSESGELHVGAEVMTNEVQLDRFIQKIQSFPRVRSARLHPLLCALTSAHEVAYTEQREWPGTDEASGKFRSLFLDIFGEDRPENEYWAVDREAVRAYKVRVEARMDLLRGELRRMLA